MSREETVEVTTLVAVDPDTAFATFTEDVDLWWRRGPRFRVRPDRPSAMRFEPEVGGRLLEVYDDASGDWFEHGRVFVWKPGERLVFGMSGRDFPPGETVEVEVRFEREGAGTRVTVESRGWERYADDHPVRHGLSGPAFAAMMGSWWAELLNAHRAHAERR